MIAIRINRTHWLQLYADTKLDITLTSPVFSDKVIEENSVYNFTIPNTPHNAGILGHPGRAQRMDRAPVSFDAEIFHNGKFVKRGAAIIRKATSKGIEMVIGVDDSGFAVQHGKKLISSFEYQGQMLYKDSYNTELDSILHVCNGTFPEYPFAYFPVKNVALFDGSQWETGWRTDPLSRPYQNDYIPRVYDPVGGTYKYNTNHISISPFPYVGFVIEEIFKECGYSVEYNIFAHDDNLKRMCIYNPNIIFGVGTNRDNFYINIGEHLPEITVLDFLKAMKKPFALCYVIDEGMKTVSIRSFNQMLDVRTPITSYEEVESTDESNRIKFKVSVDGNDAHASERQKPDEIEKGNNRGTYYSVAALSGISTPVEGDIALVLTAEINDFYIYSSAQDGTYSWQLLSYNVQHEQKGETEDKETEYELDFSLLFGEGDDIYQQIIDDDDRWTLPIVEIVGNKRNRAMEPTLTYNEFGLTIMMYWGLGQTLQGLAYPQGSSTIYDEGYTSPGSRYINLFPNQPYNFIEVYLSRYYQTLVDQKIKSIKRKTSVSDASTVNWLKTELLNGRRYLITKHSFTLSHSGISIVEQELTEIF